MGTLLNDFRYGLRLFVKTPGFSLIAVLTLAVGIGANTTVFTWINSILLNPYPGVSEPGRLVALETLAPSGEHVTTSYLDFRDIRDHATLLEGISVSQPRAVNLGDELHAERVWSQLVSGSFFDMLGIKPELGRFFAGAEKDDAQNAHAVAVISHSLWKTRFRSDPNVVGTVIRINRYPFAIIGVAPENFHGSMAGLSFQVWVPATMFGQVTSTGTWMLRDRKTRMFLAGARLKPGVSIEQARDELASISRRMAEAEPSTNKGIGITAVPMRESTFGAERVLGAPLTVLMAVCGVVLLIVCANVANLLLARATARRKEFSIRTALGAGSPRLVRQVLAESVLLAVTSSVFGLVMTAWTRGTLKWLLPQSTIPALLDPPLDVRVFLFTEAAAIAVALVAGLAPALHAARSNVHDVLKETGRSASSGAQSGRMRDLLVFAEVALAVVALAGAGLFVKSFRTSRTLSPGFDPANVVIAEFDLTTANYDRVQADSFCRRLRDRMATVPGVKAVSYADFVPLGFQFGSWEDLQIQGYVPGPAENMKIYRTVAAPGYFDLMRIPLIEGRDFTNHDDKDSQQVMIVNQEFARRFLPGRNPIGYQVQGWGRWFTIVGVVKDSKYHHVTEPPLPYFYVPIRQVFRPEEPMSFYVRASAAPDQAIAALRREAREIDPAVSLFNAQPLGDFIAASLFPQRLAATLLSVLGAIALILAATGLYAVLAYTITQRTQEIGIRVALGAQPRTVLRMVMRQALLLTAGGLAAGIFTALVLARFASRTLVSASPSDPEVYAAVAAFLVAVAVVASWLPARRAMRVEPTVALRYQ